MNGMKRFVLAGASALFASASFGVTVTVDKVQQRYPWNGKVDIDYTVAYAEGESELNVLKDRLMFYAIDGSSKVPTTNLVANLSVAPTPVAAGSHRITWQADADGLPNPVASLSVVARVTHHVAKYIVVDLSGGKDAASYPVTYLDGAPVGGFNTTAYKDSKLVLRLIPAGNYTAGSPTTESGRNANYEAQRPVMITKPFYIGIFEMTQKQNTYVTGSANGGNVGDYRPVDHIAWTDVRGYYWPEYARPSSGSIVGKLSLRTGLKFDLPTEGQWEYACRAGTTTAFNDGVSQDYGASMNALGRYSGNTSDGKGGYSTASTTVGSYEPNAWGLYDMHGNVWEYTLDAISKSSDIASQNVDPAGIMPSTSSLTCRGGAYNYSASDCRSAYRSFTFSRGNGGNSYIGYRVVVNPD